MSLDLVTGLTREERIARLRSMLTIRKQIFLMLYIEGWTYDAIEAELSVNRGSLSRWMAEIRECYEICGLKWKARVLRNGRQVQVVGTTDLSGLKSALHASEGRVAR